MAKGDQINIRPHFRDEEPQEPPLPCEGKAGDLFVFTPLNKEDERDGSAQGLASLWFCTKGMDGERPATWKRVQFDGMATCDVKHPRTPSQNLPTLEEG